MKTKTEDKTPNPGSEKAIEMGCKCPVMDNSYGRGYYGDGDTFVYSMECKVHNKEWVDNKNNNTK